MLSVFLFGIGTAHAIYGVPDDVPGQDLAWPVICAVNPGAPNDLNTNWAIADLIGEITTNNNSGFSAGMACQIRDRRSRPGPDFTYVWTPFQVVTDICENGVDGLLDRHPTAKTATATYDPIQTIDGVSYYVLYVTCTQTDMNPTVQNTITSRFMNNVYLLDPPKGFASGFNGPSLEDGSDPLIGEAVGAFHMTASRVFARYYVNNANADSWDWLIFLLGRNQYSNLNLSTSRRLTGFICDENEHCTSANINIPDELNIFSVGPTLPGSPFFTPLGNNDPTVPSTFPKAGFYSLTPLETGTHLLGGNITINGTANVGDPAFSGGNPNVPFYSLFGWSYQRAEAGSILANFDVIQPVFRTYCSGGVNGAGATENLGACSCVSQIGGGASGCQL